MIRFVFLLLLSIGLVSSGWTQSFQSPEYLYGRLDKEFYVAGEDIWFAVFVMNPTEQHSQILYVDLIAPNGKPVQQHMLKIEGHVAVGDFALPSDLQKGYYLMRAYTTWNLNFSPQEIFEREIAVYEARNVRTGLKSPPLAKATPVRQSQGFTLTLNQSTFLPGEPVELSIRGNAAAYGNPAVSVSVLDRRYISETGTKEIDNRFEKIQEKGRVGFAGGRQVIPPEKGYTRNFVLKKQGSEEFVSSNFVMGYIKQTQQKLIQATKEGIVSFTFDDFYGNTVIQIFDTNPFEPTYIPTVSLVSSGHPIHPPKLNPASPPETPEVLQYIDAYQKRYQLIKLFGVDKSIRAGQTTTPSFPLQPTNVYKVDDFVQHESMEDFVKNVIPPVKVTKAKKNFVSIYQTGQSGAELRQFQLYVPNKDNRNAQKVVKKPPILLINEYFSYDVEAVLGMEWESIQQIDVYNTAQNLPVQFGPIGNFGVIGFRTRDGQTPKRLIQSANNLMIQGYYRPRNFVREEQKGSEATLSRIPDFQPMNYWNPRVLLQANEAVTLHFHASDQPGSYLVRVEGVGQWGNLIVAEQIIEVKL